MSAKLGLAVEGLLTEMEESAARSDKLNMLIQSKTNAQAVDVVDTAEAIKERTNNMLRKRAMEQKRKQRLEELSTS